MSERLKTDPTVPRSNRFFERLNRSIRAQFNLTTILLAVAPVVLVALALTWFSLARVQTALEADAYKQLTTVRSDRIEAVERYFREVQNDMADLLNTVETLRQTALDQLLTVNRNKTLALGRLFSTWQADALDIASDPSVIAGMAAMDEGMRALSASRARAAYLGKPLLDDAGDRSAYSVAHREQHSFFTTYIQLHGYNDALLINMQGDVVYSVRKSETFGANVASGNYTDTPLAAVYKALRQAPPGTTFFADLGPLGDEQVMLLGASVYSRTTHIGILVYQLSFEPINVIVQERAGLKAGTESYLIARADETYTYRSDRVIKSGEIGDPRPYTEYNAAAFISSGTMIAPGSTGVYELIAYEPLNLPDVQWAILTTGSARENFAPELESAGADFYVAYTRQNGFYDLFLIQPDGYVFYSVKRENDFETNMLTGPYKDTNFGRLVAYIERERQYAVSDFAFYEPSGGEPAAFAAKPLLNRGQVELIVAVQLPVKPLEEIVSNYAGLGNSGETLLAGPDLFARSSLRMVPGPWLLTRKLDTVAIRSALQGNFNNGDLITDYRGVPVFNAWGPVEIAGADFRWALAAKIDQTEALQPVYELRNTIVIGSLALVAIVAFIAIGVGTTLSTRLVQPILGLTDTARAIAAGNFGVKPPATERKDEVGVLSNALTTMVERLEASINDLQDSNRQVQARTEQLEANQRAIQVVFSAGGAFQIDELLALVVNLIRDRFNLYHVQIYLLDDDQENALLRQSTGFAGQQLLARKHSIPMERVSLVTTAIREAQPVLVADVKADPNFLPNPLLPDTRAELVVPFKVGDAVLGALDAQSRDVGFFTEDTVTLFETMIGQIGLMFQNAQLFTDVTERTEALTVFTNQLSVAADIGRRLNTILDPEYLLNETVELLRSRFGFYHTHIYLLDEETNELVVRAGSGEVGRVLRERRHSIPLNREHSRVARAAREQGTQVVNDTALDSDFQPNPLLPQTRSELSVPMVVGNRVLGVLDIQDDQPNRFSQAERDTFATLAAQIATALDNARLFQETQARQAELDRRAAELQTVAEVSTAAATSLDPAHVLQQVVELTKANFDLYHAHIYLYDEEKQALVLAAGAGEPGARMLAQGWQIPIERERSIVVQTFLTRKGIIANDVQAAPDFLPNPLLPKTASEMAVPMIIGDQILGVLDVQSDHVGRFTPQDVVIKTTLAEQVATTLQNARLFESQRRAEEAVRNLARQNQLVLDSAAEGIFGVDQNGVTVFVNPAAVKMLGFDAEELIGGVHHHLIHHHRADGSAYPVEECKVYAAYRDGLTHTGEDEIYWHKDGHSFPVSYTSTPIKDDDGVILGAVVTFRDITEELAARAAIEKRARELQTVAEVSSAAAASLDPTELLLQVSQLTKERFELYHAHIYLYDPDNHTLKLAAGAGEAGQHMVARGWSIPADSETSLVARAFRTRAGVIANNVRAAPDFLPNPLLPDTASELAAPLIAGEQTLGVLDVQSTLVGRFTEEDIFIKTTLAGQVAAALENARLFAETERSAFILNERLKEINCLYTVGALLDQEGISLQALAQGVADVLPTALQYAKIGYARVVLEDQEFRTANYVETPWRMPSPIEVRGKPIGLIEVGYLEEKPELDEGPFMREERALLDNVARQLDDAFEREQAEREISRQVAILNTSRDFIAIAAPSGHIVYVNQGGASLLGYEKPEDFIGKVIADSHDEAGLKLVAEVGIPTAIQTGFWRGENALRRTDGIFIPVDQTIFPILDEAGNLQYLATIMSDITERRQAEAALLNSQARLTEAADIAQLVYWEFDVPRGVFIFNDSFYASLGTTAAQEGGYEIPAEVYATRYVHPEDAAVVGQNVGAAIQTTDPDFSIATEARVIRADGEIRYVSVRFRIEKDAEGNTIRLIGANQDITARKQTEEEIRRLALVAQETDNAVIITSPDKLIEWVNPGFTRLTEYTLEEVVGKKPGAFLQGADTDPATVQRIREAIARRASVTAELINYSKSGRQYWLEINIQPIFDEQGELIRFIAIESDVTERRRVQEEIRASEERFRDVATSAVGWVWEVDAQGRYIYVSEKVFEVLGFTVEETLGKTPFDFMLPEEVERIAPLFGEIAGSKQPIVNLENWNLHKDGARVCMLTNGVPMLDNDGNLLGYRGVDTDITERKAAEAEIQKRAAELQTVAEVSTAVSSTLQTDILLQSVVELTKERFDLYHAHIYLYDEKENVLRLAAGAGEAGRQMKAEGWSIPADRERSLVARAFRTNTGVIENDVRAIPDFLPNPLLPDTASEMAIPVVAAGRVLGVLDVQSARVGRFTEEDVVVKTTLSRQIGTALENARLFEETQNVAERLREVDRLKSEFLANMSHELRTPLNSILGYTQLLLLDLEGEIAEESYEDLTSIDTNGKHLLSLINDILDLAKIEAGRMQLHKEAVEVGALLDHVQSNNAGLFVNKNLDFIVETGADLPTIWADQIRVTQILNNLISNAAKFTEEGAVTVRAYHAGERVCISVTDTGIGISANDLDAIFEKFRQVDGSFTRRAEGTGLGLPITRYLVEMHGGHLDVLSEVGQGSTFTACLPIAPPEPEAE